MKTLWQYAEEKTKKQLPDQNVIVMQRRGCSESVHGQVPGGHGEIMDTHDEHWMALLEYEKTPGHFYRAHRKVATREQAIQALKDLVVELTESSTEFEIAPQIQAGWYPKSHSNDWYKVTVILKDNRVISVPDGQEIARFENGEMIAADAEWSHLVEKANECYQKSYAERIYGKEGAKGWATYLLNSYATNEGKSFQWRQEIML